MGPLICSLVYAVDDVLLSLQQQGVTWAPPDRASRLLTSYSLSCSLLLSVSTQPAALQFRHPAVCAEALRVDLEAIAVRRRRFSPTVTGSFAPKRHALDRRGLLPLWLPVSCH